MKKSIVLILFVACVFTTTNKLFAQPKSVQDKLMKHKWFEYYFNRPPYSYTKYNKTESLYTIRFNKAPKYKGTPYYLSDNINSKIFDYSKVGKSINGKYLYVQVGKPNNNAYIYEILKLNRRKLIIKLVYPNPKWVVGPPSTRIYNSKPL